MSVRSLPRQTNQRAQQRSHGTHAIDKALANKLGPGGRSARTVRCQERLQLPENPFITGGRVRDNRTRARRAAPGTAKPNRLARRRRQRPRGATGRRPDAGPSSATGPWRSAGNSAGSRPSRCCGQVLESRHRRMEAAPPSVEHDDAADHRGNRPCARARAGRTAARCDQSSPRSGAKNVWPAVPTARSADSTPSHAVR